MDTCQRRAKTVLLAALLVSVAAVVYLAENLSIDTDTEDMLSAELPFRKNANELDAAFPQLEDNLLVVLEAPNADAADDGVRRLVEALEARSEIFDNVLAPEAHPFLRKHGLLYLDQEELEDLSVRLAGAQPFLGTLWQQPNLKGLAGMLDLLAQAGDDATLDQASSVLLRMAEVTEEVRAGEESGLVWSEIILGKEPGNGPAQRLIQTRPKLDYGSLDPVARAQDAIHEIADVQGLTGDGFNIRLTGSAAMESDELKSVEAGMGLAGMLSLCIVVAVLMIGLRSPGMMVALFVTLLAGLLWTAAFAILALGSLNLISVAFAVLFVGLSVDFGIHFTLRSTEYANDPAGWRGALRRGGRSVGGSLAVCTVTTAIAFFSFLPTNYVGLAELGLIAGVGMFVAFVCNLTLLPALLRLLVQRPPTFVPSAGPTRAWPVRRGTARIIVVAGFLSAVVSGWLATEARFDFDPMNLKDRKSPSVATLFDLMQDGAIHPYSAEVLAGDLATAEALVDDLSALDAVESVESIHTLIPAGQDAKLAVIERMALFLGPAFFAPAGATPLDGENLTAALREVRENLSQLVKHPVLGAPANKLSDAFSGIDAIQVMAVNDALFRYLPGRLNDLALALDAGPVGIDALPDDLKRRYLSESGHARLEILPAADLRDTDALRRFVTEVQSIAPTATGAPVVIVEAGRAVLEAFGTALIISLAGVGTVLWLVLRRIGDVLLVFAPVCVAAIWTLAVSAVADVPFNFANVIVLPLLFGLSVDFGIHIVMRQRAITGSGDAMATTTPRAVLLSALTTLGSFGSIMLSGHPGTASMGLLLTIAIFLSLVAILVLLPALMRLFMRTAAE
ncbi:MAG: MMPL family transporter [Rhodospirillales bacterium]